MLNVDPAPRPRSAKSLETLVKMGMRLGCKPDSPHLTATSVDAATLAALESQTQHLAPLHEAMDGLAVSGAGACPIA